MAIHWHPLLAQFLRQDYGDRLDIEEEVNLGDLPLRADLVLIRRDPTVALPYPFNHLGATTLVEFKGPHETAGQKALTDLEIYGLLYHQRTKLRRRDELTLWLVASRLGRRVSQPTGAYLEHPRSPGPGVRGGVLDRFPTYLVDLNELPVRSETLPLVMVSRGPQERALVEYLVDHRHEHPEYVRHLKEMHRKTLKEVMAMRQLTLEEWGIDDPDEYAADVFAMIGKNRLVRTITKVVGEEELLRGLMSEIGAAKFHQLTEKLTREATDEPAGPGRVRRSRSRRISDKARPSRRQGHG
jgi:hypothetical protein